MYAESGVMFPYFQNFSHEVQQFDEFCSSQKPNSSSGIPSSLIQTTTISDYNLGGEGDLFKAPEPVIGEPLMGVDPMTAAISMISCGEDVISPQSLTVSDIESSIECGQLLSEVFYECRKDLLAKQVLDFGAFNGMRRAFSEGDIKTLDNDGNKSLEQSPTVQPRITSSCTSDERREKLSRYWNKKSKRNFGRKIKYACRKALADSQPRIRGRFAKTE